MDLRQSFQHQLDMLNDQLANEKAENTQLHQKAQKRREEHHLAIQTIQRLEASKDALIEEHSHALASLSQQLEIREIREICEILREQKPISIQSSASNPSCGGELELEFS